MFTYVSREVHHSGQRHRRCTDENPDAHQLSDSRHSCHITDASQDYTMHVGTALFALPHAPSDVPKRPSRESNYE